MDIKNALEMWYDLEKQIMEKKTEMDELKNQQKDIKAKLLEYSENNDMGNKTVSVNNKKMKFTVTKSSEPFTIKYLETYLGKIIKNEDQLEQTIDFIKDNREVKYSYGLKIVDK